MKLIAAMMSAILSLRIAADIPSCQIVTIACIAGAPFVRVQHCKVVAPLVCRVVVVVAAVVSLIDFECGVFCCRFGTCVDVPWGLRSLWGMCNPQEFVHGAPVVRRRTCFRTRGLLQPSENKLLATDVLPKN